MLCIVQDDVARKHEQIMQMDVIYRHAFLTIISLSGRDATASLPGVQPGARLPIRHQGLVEKVETLQLHIEMVSEPASPSLFVDESPYESRAWTFQEKILSRRCLYFTPHQAFFQCREGNLTEAMWTERSNESMTFHEVSKNTIDETNLFDPLREFLLAASGYQMNSTVYWDCYSRMVALYTFRVLSYPSDIINAFSGILSFLGEHRLASIVQGIPLDFADLALYWVAAGPTQRREVGQYPGNGKNSKFPSWSWSGWIGPTVYLAEDMTAGKSTQYEIRALNFVKEGKEYKVKRKRPAFRPDPSRWTATKYDIQGYFDASITQIMLLAPTIDFRNCRLGDIHKTAETSSSKIWQASTILDSSDHRCGVLLDYGRLSNRNPSELPFDPESHKFLLISSISRRLSQTDGGYTQYLPDGRIFGTI